MPLVASFDPVLCFGTCGWKPSEEEFRKQNREGVPPSGHVAEWSSVTAGVSDSNTSDAPTRKWMAKALWSGQQSTSTGRGRWNAEGLTGNFSFSQFESNLTALTYNHYSSGTPFGIKTCLYSTWLFLRRCKYNTVSWTKATHGSGFPMGLFLLWRGSTTSDPDSRWWWEQQCSHDTTVSWAANSTHFPNPCVIG